VRAQPRCRGAGGDRSEDRAASHRRRTAFRNGGSAAFNDLPIKTVNGTVIYMRDVADVHHGSPPQTNVVHVDGKNAVLLAVIKAGAVSTLSIISDIKQLLPSVTKTLILLFLGNWRSTLIISISIPLAILASLTVLSVLGETINVMSNPATSIFGRRMGWSREQSTADLRAARYDIIIAGENWAMFEQAGLPQLQAHARARDHALIFGVQPSW
jgi:hypothetical protein